jgi:hypothetical protein
MLRRISGSGQPFRKPLGPCRCVVVHQQAACWHWYWQAHAQKAALPALQAVALPPAAVLGAIGQQGPFLQAAAGSHTRQQMQVCCGCLSEWVTSMGTAMPTSQQGPHRRDKETYVAA